MQYIRAVAITASKVMAFAGQLAFGQFFSSRNNNFDLIFI